MDSTVIPALPDKRQPPAPGNLASPLVPAPENRSVFAKVADIMADLAVAPIPKQGFNKSMNFYFVRDEDQMGVLQPIVARHRLLILPQIYQVGHMDGETARGGKRMHVKLWMAFTLCDPETGQSVTLPWFGEAQDTQDKAITKATTLAKKYFLKALFLLAVTDADDPDGAPPVEYERSAARPVDPPREAERHAPAVKREEPEPPTASVSGDMGVGKRAARVAGLYPKVSREELYAIRDTILGTEPKPTTEALLLLLERMETAHASNGGPLINSSEAAELQDAVQNEYDFDAALARTQQAEWAAGVDEALADGETDEVDSEADNKEDNSADSEEADIATIQQGMDALRDTLGGYGGYA